MQQIVNNGTSGILPGNGTLEAIKKDNQDVIHEMIANSGTPPEFITPVFFDHLIAVGPVMAARLLEERKLFARKFVVEPCEPTGFSRAALLHAVNDGLLSGGTDVNDNGVPVTLEPPDIQSLILKPEPTPVDRSLLKLDLGCGQNKREGFIGVDKFACDGVDVVHDLVWDCMNIQGQWPWDDNSVGEVHCSHFFEHVTAFARPKFMDELWRVMAHGAKALFITPFARSYRATQDFTHQWPPITEQSYLYFNRGWREANKLTHGYYDMQCDFDWMYADAMRTDWAGKHEQQRAFAREHYMNVVEDLHVTLIARKAAE